MTTVAALAGVPSAASARTYLASIVGVPLRAGEFMDKFSINTWNVEVVAVCRFPPGWRLTAGKDASPDGIIAGEGSHGVTWLDRGRLRELGGLMLVRLDRPVRRKTVTEAATGATQPATFAGTAHLGTYGNDDHPRSVALTYANVRLVPAASCPRVAASRS